jgi:hypothetical protein
MNYSYTAVYESYAKFCGMIGQSPLPFEDWMHAREDSGEHQDLAKDFLRSSVPGSPVPACSPR